jgi:hypothetical protein
VFLVAIAAAGALPSPGFYPYGAGLLPYQRSLLLKKAALGLIGTHRSPFALLSGYHGLLPPPSLTIHKKIGVPILKPVHIHVDKPVPVIVKKKVPVFYDAPYPVEVIKPVEYFVDKPVPVHVDSHFPHSAHAAGPLDVSLTPDFSSFPSDVHLGQSF